MQVSTFAQSLANELSYCDNIREMIRRCETGQRHLSKASERQKFQRLAKALLVIRDLQSKNVRELDDEIDQIGEDLRHFEDQVTSSIG